MERKVLAIAAMDEGRVIGLKGALPWHVPEDMRRFKRLTTGHTVLMGRKTYEILPDEFKPLPGRKNIVVTRSPSGLKTDSGVEVRESAEETVSAFRSGEIDAPSGELWIIGGAQIYAATRDLWDEIHLTLIPGRHQGDAFFPEFEKDFELAGSEQGKACVYLHYRRKP